MYHAFAVEFVQPVGNLIPIFRNSTTRNPPRLATDIAPHCLTERITPYSEVIPTNLGPSGQSRSTTKGLLIPRHLAVSPHVKVPRAFKLPRYGVRVPEADLNEAALRRTLARDTIWQGNCDLCGQQLRSNIASVRNTISIQCPYKQLPCQKSFLQVAVSKARRVTCLLFRNMLDPARFRTALRLIGSDGDNLLQACANLSA